MPRRPNWQTTCEGFVCSICWTNFSATDFAMKPRVAPQCGHSFCLGCLEAIARTSRTQPPTTRCPSCRGETNILPKNFVINYAMLDVINSMNEAKDRQRPAKTKKGEGILVQCFENQNHEADLYCTSCKEAYCEKCYMKAHEKSRIMQQHKAIKISDKPEVIPMCSEHPHRQAIFHCPVASCLHYEKVGCGECGKLYHRDHPCSKILYRIKANSDMMKECHKLLQEKKETLTSHQKDIIGSIKSFGSSDTINHHEQLITEHFGPNEDESALRKYRIFVLYEKKQLECQKKDITFQIRQIEILDKKLLKKWLQKFNLHEAELILEARKNLRKRINKTKVFFKLEEYNFRPDMSARPSRPVEVAASTSGR
ncbi:unnamed protein product [Caenorhabditis brenneri]